ncbi:hypothetical protein HK100_002437 [Physocladia obscura]|uniref:RRM domain-containing protein n=1 Tax=Physocladia obscura TaxID=109957 RepID=A0AAD5XH64_9FUNG|nr:hypothetical protein HK100_002437 [Physocladia obscura]
MAGNPKILIAETRSRYSQTTGQEQMEQEVEKEHGSETNGDDCCDFENFEGNGLQENEQQEELVYPGQRISTGSGNADTAPSIGEDSSGPVVPNMPQACIFVANLDSSKTDNDLFSSMWSHFTKWGAINEIKMDRDIANRPFAFVQFKNIGDAKRALQEAQRDSIDDREIRIEMANVIRTLRVKFNPNWDCNAVEDHFSKFGPIEDFTVLRYRDTGDPKGVVFIKYFSRTDAIKAYLKIRKLPKWNIEWVKKTRSFEVDNRLLFVGKLNDQLVTEDLLREKFERYGEILTIRLFKNSLAAAAFAFIQYSNGHDAELAIDELHGSRWLDRIIKVQYREISQQQPNNYNHNNKTAFGFEQMPQQQLQENGVSFIRPFYGGPGIAEQPMFPSAATTAVQPIIVSPPPQYQFVQSPAQTGVPGNFPFQASDTNQYHHHRQQQPQVEYIVSHPVTAAPQYQSQQQRPQPQQYGFFVPAHQQYHQQQPQVRYVPQQGYFTPTTSAVPPPLQPGPSYSPPQMYQHVLSATAPAYIPSQQQQVYCDSPHVTPPTLQPAYGWPVTVRNILTADDEKTK